jgi:hypothetical protein
MLVLYSVRRVAGTEEVVASSSVFLDLHSDKVPVCGM